MQAEDLLRIHILYAAMGKVKVTVVPAPIGLRISIRSPCCSTSHWAMESPSPVPPGSRARRDALYEQVKMLHSQGKNISQTARHLSISPSTVKKFTARDVFPESRSARQRSMLCPYVRYLQTRWDEGCRGSQQLWRELQAQGPPGSSRMVWLWVALRRDPTKRGRRPSREVRPLVPPDTHRQSILLRFHFPKGADFAALPDDELQDVVDEINQRLRKVPGYATAHEVLRGFALLDSGAAINS